MSNTKNLLSKPPKPPECRLQCSFCGYTEVESKYKHICWSGIVCSVLLILCPVSLLIYAVYLNI